MGMDKSVFKTRIFRAAAILLSIFIAVFFFELFLRICGPKYFRFNKRSDEYYTNPRGYHLFLRNDGGDNIYGLKYRETAEGYRLPDKISYVENNNEKYNHFILGIGDSFTYGQGVKYEDLYLTRLERLLDKDNRKIKVENRGLDGADINKIFEVYLFESSKRSYPLVIYGFMLNDFGLFGAHKIIGSDFVDINNGGNRWNAWRSNLASVNLIAYVMERRRLHNHTMKAYLDAFKGEYARLGFKTLGQLNQGIKSKGGTLVITLFPLIYNFKNHPFREIHDKISRFCIQENIPFLDLLPAFSEYRPEELWVNPTDYHPNEIAHRIAAENIYHFLKKGNLLKSLTDKYSIDD
jgi:lysophospholipase L1-like esterase